MDKKLSSTQMLLDIVSMRNQAMKLLNENKEYIPLLKVITENDYINDESLHIPNVIELAHLSGLAYLYDLNVTSNNHAMTTFTSPSVVA